MKDIKDKSDELKSKGREILNLRKNITMVKSENVRLVHAMHAEDMIQMECEQRAAQQEKQAVDQMNIGELKSKLLKLAQAYKASRLRNIEFEDQIRLAYRDIESIPDL